MKKNQNPLVDAVPAADPPGSPQAGGDLRRRAEERLGEKQKGQKSEASDQRTTEDTARLVHELQVHQIELKMQNEVLLQARAAADALLAQYTDLYDFAPAGYLTLDREGTIRQVNLFGARLLGVERARLVNRRFGLFVAESDRHAFSDFLERVLANEGEKSGGRLTSDAGGNGKESCEVPLSRDGLPPIVVEIEGMRSTDGQECRAVVLDITARKRAKEELRAVSLYTRNLIEVSLDPLVTIGLEGTITDVNKATEDATGASRDQLIGSDFAAYFTEPEKARAGYRQVFEQGAVRDYPLAIKNVSGADIDVLYNAVTYKDEAGRVKGVFAAARDITERKRAEEALRTSLAGKEVLIREIHHRVKNNLQVISSILNLQSAATSNEECRGILQEMRTRIHSMSLVHEKLFQSQNLENINIGDYIRSLAGHLFQAYLVKPGQVRLELESEEVLLDINSALPCGLLLNELIANALKHAFPEGRTGVLKIGLRRSLETLVELRVEDDGVGFPEGLDFRKGTTFGLQIVNALASQLEATIELERTNGTVFTIKFRKLNYRPRL